MEIGLSARDAFALGRRAKVILARMDAGLYYRWDLGYNTLLREEDLDHALSKSDRIPGSHR